MSSEGQCHVQQALHCIYGWEYDLASDLYITVDLRARRLLPTTSIQRMKKDSTSMIRDLSDDHRGCLDVSSRKVTTLYML